MKKILSIFLVAGILVACNDSKKETTTETTTTTTDTTTSPAVTTTETTTTTKPALEVPKFTNPDVQKFADEYAAFVTTAGKLKADNADEYSKKNLEFNKRKGEMDEKLGKDQAEAKKLEDFLTKADEVLDAQTEVQ